MERAMAGSALGSVPTSLYGYDLLNSVEGYQRHLSSAYETAVFALTHGDSYPLEQALRSLGTYDRAAYAALEARRHLPVSPAAERMPGAPQLVVYINTLGRLHIRRAEMARPEYAARDQWVDIGVVDVGEQALREIEADVKAANDAEEAALHQVKRSMDRLHARGGLPAALERGIDSIQHIDNICFYIDDHFFALLERYANLIDTKSGKGCLSRLPTKPYEQWTSEEMLIVAALHALFLSGGAGRLEEFNGLALSARGLIERIERFCEVYRSVGCSLELSDEMDLFEVAAAVGEQARTSVGKPWLRYRWIYGLNFQKVEQITSLAAAADDPELHLAEFGQDHRDLVSGRRSHPVPEQLFFTELACACLSRDLAEIPCNRGSDAAAGWIEYLMEKIVVSAVRAARADYGMSSSLRDVSRLVEYDEAKRVANVHALNQYDFFTCFVSRNLDARLGAEAANAIALAVQKRMMFNRWHFIPGNLDRHRVAKARHWFFPPSVPDIAAHSNMHRAAHSKAQVKFSIRAPGPDWGRPALQIAGQPYRGFYDVRVVRMEGDEGFSVDDLLRVRRRSLWLESLYNVLVSYLQGTPPVGFAVKGFQPGSFLDLVEGELASGKSVRERNVMAHTQP